MLKLPILFLVFSLLTLSEPEIPTHTYTPSTEKSEGVYDRLLNLTAALPSKQVFDLAANGWEKLQGNINNPILTIIDFSLPSTEKRMWVIDMNAAKVLLNTVVSHGRNSGQLMAKSFSNQPESYKSSLGFYKTAETYFGKHGYSLRLDGLEKGFNDQARNRAIVIHGADYAKEEFAAATGRLGRSLGCPALPSEISKEAIDYIKEGSLLFVFGNDPSYLQASALLQP